jgi:hypothetical protein
MRLLAPFGLTSFELSQPSDYLDSLADSLKAVSNDELTFTARVLGSLEAFAYYLFNDNVLSDFPLMRESFHDNTKFLRPPQRSVVETLQTVWAVQLRSRTYTSRFRNFVAVRPQANYDVDYRFEQLESQKSDINVCLITPLPISNSTLRNEKYEYEKELTARYTCSTVGTNNPPLWRIRIPVEFTNQVREELKRVLATIKKIDAFWILVLPELGVSKELVDEISRESNGMLIFSGAYYDAEGYSVAEVLGPTPGERLWTQRKLRSAQTEAFVEEVQTPEVRKIAIRDLRVGKIPIGRFVVAVCRDFLDDDTGRVIVESGTNMIVVPSLTRPKTVPSFHETAGVFVQKLRAFVMYCNNGLAGGSFMRLPFRLEVPGGTLWWEDMKAMWVSTRKGSERLISFISLTDEAGAKSI